MPPIKSKLKSALKKHMPNKVQMTKKQKHESEEGPVKEAMEKKLHEVDNK